MSGGIGEEHIRWCDEMKERLIAEFRQRECLWSPANRNYRSLRVKRLNVTEIAAKLSAEFGTPVSEGEILRQWNMLRDQYRRAKRTRKFQWRFSNSLSFLNYTDFPKGSLSWLDNSQQVLFGPYCGLLSSTDPQAGTSTGSGTSVSGYVKEEDVVGLGSCSATAAATSTVLDALVDAAPHSDSESFSPEILDDDGGSGGVGGAESYADSGSLPESQMETKSTFSKKTAQSTSSADAVTPTPLCTDDVAIALQDQLSSQLPFTMKPPPIEDQFTHFGRTVENKLRLIYRESPADAIRLERIISEAIFEKELDLLTRESRG